MTYHVPRIASYALILGLTVAALAACGAPSSPTAAQPRPTVTAPLAVLPTATGAPPAPPASRPLRQPRSNPRRSL